MEAQRHPSTGGAVQGRKLSRSHPSRLQQGGRGGLDAEPAATHGSDRGPKKYGLEAAQVICWHERTDVTQVYAERER